MLLWETKLVHYDKCKISHTKLIKIKQYQPCTLLELFPKKMLWMLDPHQSLIDFVWITIVWNYENCIHAY